MAKSKSKVLGTMLALSIGFLPLTSSAYALIDLNTEVETNVETDVNTGGDANVTVDTNTEMTANALIEGQVINVNRASVSASAETDAEGSIEVRVEPVQSANVSTNADLEAYARSTVEGDVNVEGMIFTQKSVELKYKETGRLLALIPVTYTVTASAHADGEVEVDYPWYAFLTVDNKDEIETELKVAVDHALKARTVGSVTAEGEVENPVFTAKESAQVAAEMHAVLQAKGEIMQSTGN